MCNAEIFGGLQGYFHFLIGHVAYEYIDTALTE